MTPPSVIVVGAGALGSAMAAVFLRRGWRVDLIDGAEAPSASEIAAGMLAPAFETLLDQPAQGRADLLRAARDLWPELAQTFGVTLVRDGASWGGAEPDRIAADLSRLGFAHARRIDSVFTSEDWRLDPEPALRALAEGARLVRDRALTVDADHRRAWMTLGGGDRLEADHVVLATGTDAITAPGAALALAAVQPIRGQLVEVDAPPPPCVLRAEGVYVVPRGERLLVGASMEPGRRDLGPDPHVTRGLLERAAALWPAVRERPATARVGVRGTSPNGLPLAGPVSPRVSVALAPRRNGWLLAPLVARIVAAYATGNDPGPFAAALDPMRFQPK